MPLSSPSSREIRTRLGRLELWEGELFMLERRRRGATQLGLQRETGIAQVAISMWELGMDMPDEIADELWGALEGRALKEKPDKPAAKVQTARVGERLGPDGRRVVRRANARKVKLELVESDSGVGA